MKKNPPRSNAKIIVLTICLFYTIGIILGLVINKNILPFNLLTVVEYSDNPLINHFIYYIKFTFPVWAAGIFAVGIFLSMPTCLFCGFLYGVSITDIIALQSPINFAVYFIQFLFFTATVFVFTTSSANLSLGKYKKYKSSKTNLPREKIRQTKEHIIVLLLGCIFTLLAALIKLYT